MGYVLLWIECLAVGLAVVTTFLAWLARTKLPRWRLIGGIVVVLLMPVLTCGALLSGVSRRHWGQQFVTSMFNPLVALSAGYLVGATGLVVWGLRRRGAGSSESVAAGWDLRKCVLAVLIGILVFSVTYRRLDQQVCQRLVKIGVEADELASSVAPPLLPEKKNAAIIYRRVFDSWKNTYPWPPVWEDALDAMSASSTQEKVEFDFRATELTDFLVERAADLELLRRASALPGCRFDRDFERLSFGAVFPENRKMKTATLLFGVEAHRQAALGNTSKALENVNAMFAIAQHTASEPILLSVLSGAAIEGMAFKTLQTVLLTEKMQEEDSTLELAAGISYQSRISESIRMEKVTGLRTFSELVPWRDPDEAGEQFDNLIPGIPSLYRIFLFDHDIRYYRETIGHFEDLANEPYRKTKQEWDDFYNSPEASNGGVLASLLLPAMSSCVEAFAGSDAGHRTAQVAWAMHRYQAVHGEFPERLADLVPGTLRRLPLDPFDGKPIKLRRSTHGWVVYSIGYDMKDDDGQSMDWKTKVGDLTFGYQESIKARGNPL